MSLLLAFQGGGGTAYFATVSETVTLSEVLAAGYAANASPSETVTLSEALAALASFAVSPSETVALSEALTVSVSFVAALAETVSGWTESVAVLYGAIASPAETVTLSEQLAALAAHFATPGETVTLSEALSAGVPFVVSLSETVSNWTEAMGAAYAAVVSPSETLTLSEALSAHASFATSLAETIALAEALVATGSNDRSAIYPGAVTILDIANAASVVTQAIRAAATALAAGLVATNAVRMNLVDLSVRVVAQKDPNMRQGDRLPPVTASAFTAAGFIDFTAFSSITFRMVSGSTVVTGTATGDAHGNLSYAWQAGDTNVPGTYEAVFIATDDSGKLQTFPTDTNLTIVVTPDI